MRYLFTILFIFICFNSIAQFPIDQRPGAPNTLSRQRGGVGADSGIVYVTNFVDTSYANLGFLKNIPGIQIRVGSIIYTRNAQATRWLSSLDITGCYTLLNGGIVTWSGSGLVMDVSPADYIINCNPYSSPQSQVTLATADPTNPRIDVIAVDTNSTVVVITGTPSANPITPQVNPNSQLALTSVLIPAGATTPGGVTQTVIYDQNTEWTPSASGATVNFANTNNPFHLTIAADVGAIANTNTITFTNSTPVTASSYSALKFYIRLKAPFFSSPALRRFFTVQFFNGVTPVSNQIAIGEGAYGFSNLVVGSYQPITIAFNQWTFSGSSFDRVMITFNTSNASGLYLDWVQLQSGGNGGNPVTNNAWLLTGNSGTSQATNFLGTTDNNALRFKVNNIPAGRITPYGVAYLDSVFTGGVYLGLNAGLADTGTIRNTIAIGTDALKSYAGAEPGSGQIAVGFQALTNYVGNVTTGSNIAIGTRSLARLTTGYRNVAVGLNAGHNGTTGTHNTFMGAFAGEWNSTGSFNEAFGQGALRNTTTGQVNTAIGTQALFYNTGSVISVTMTGSSSDWSTATVTFSAPDVAPFGFSSAVQATGTAIISGNQIIGVTITEPGVGYSSATVTFTGDGTSATATVTIGAGSFNVGLGADALFQNRYGYGNTAMGYRAGYQTARYRDSSNTYVGRNAAVSGSAGSDPLKFMTVIGADAVGSKSNSIILGRTTDSVGIGNTSPQDRLHVTSRARFDNAIYFPATTTSGSGYVGPFGSALLAMPNLDANGFLPAFYMRNASAGSNAAIALQMNNNLNSYLLLEMEGSNRTSFNPDGVLLATNGAGGIKMLPSTVFKIGFGTGTSNHTRIYQDSLFTGMRSATLAGDTAYDVTYNTATKELTYTPHSSGGGGSGVSQSTITDTLQNYWRLTGNTVTSNPTRFLGSVNNSSLRFRTNNVESMKLDSLGSRLFLTGGVNPLLSLTQATSNEEWQLRIGVGTGLANSVLNFYRPSSTTIAMAIRDDVVSIGNKVTGIPIPSQLYVYGGASGANIDAQPDSTTYDEANIEAMSENYDNDGGRGAAIQWSGNDAPVGTTLGYSNIAMAQLRLTGNFNIIQVRENHSLRFGIDDVERLTLDSTGKLGIGNVAPTAMLHLGTAGTSTGNIAMTGATSGTVTIRPQSIAGTWTWQLPADDGSPNQVLQTDGSGVTFWGDASAGQAVFENAGTLDTLLVTSVTGDTLRIKSIDVEDGYGINDVPTITADQILYTLSADTLQMASWNRLYKAIDSLAATGGGGGVTSITGTSNQIIASAATGAVTLSAPQDLHTGALFRVANLGLGTNASATYGLLVSNGTGAGISLSGSGYTAGGFLNTASVSPGANQTGVVFNSSGTLVEAGSGTHTLFGGVNIDPPTITGGAAAVTNLYSFRISDAPTGTATNTYSLWVDGGNARFDGNVGIGVTTASTVLHTSGTVRMASLGSASSDYTANQPVGIDSDGDIIGMTDWPAGDESQKWIAAVGGDLKAQTIGLHLNAIANGSQTLVDGRLVLIPVWLDKPATLTGIRILINAAASGVTSDNENRVGLYTITSAGTATLVASSTSSATLWTAPSSNSVLNAAFSSTYAAAAGPYYIGLLFNASAGTGPGIAGWTDLANAVRANSTVYGFSNSIKLTAYVASATLSSSITMSTTTTDIDPYWAALY